MSSDEDLSYRFDGSPSSTSQRSGDSGYSTPESDFLLSSSVSTTGAARAAAATEAQRTSPCVCERYGITRDGRRVKLDCRGLRCGAYGKRHMSISGHSDGGQSSSSSNSSRSGSPSSRVGMAGASAIGGSSSGSSSSDSASSSGDDPGSSCSSAESDDDEDMAAAAAAAAAAVAAAKGLAMNTAPAPGRHAGNMDPVLGADKLGLPGLDMSAAAAAVAAAAAEADPLVSPLAARRHAIYLR
jgi:hypothetical protein